MLSFLLDERSLTGGTVGGLAQGNAAPVAVDDVRTVVRTEGPVTISVLDNDFDPEGEPLVLVSAFAALGTAVAEADNTVTYTPPTGAPPGVIEFDTIVYEIADVEDARSTSQVDITVTDPEVTITTLADNTLEIEGGAGQIDVAVVQPAEFAGTYSADLSDLTNGPINLSPPQVSGTPDSGENLTALGGLWIYESGAGTPTQNFQWQRAGIDITGATGSSYTVQPADVGAGLRVVETQTDANGSQSSSSPTVGSFTPQSDAALAGWWDASDTASITDTGGAVSVWADKAGSADLSQNVGARQPTTGVRTVGGNNVIDFDGGDHLLQPIGLPAGGDMAFHMVLVIDSTANEFEAVLAVDAANDFQIDAASSAQFDGRISAAGIGTGVSLTGGPFAGPMILSVVCDLSGAGQLEIFVDGISRGVMAYTAAIDSVADLHLMTNRATNASVNGAVGELLITGSVANRSLYHSYLSEKWGLG